MECRSFDDLWASLEKSDSYKKRRIVIDFLFDIDILLKRRGINKKKLANKLGTSQAYITKIFQGNSNFTLETMVKLARAVDGKIDVHVSPKEEVNTNWIKVLDGGKIAKKKERITNSGVDWITPPLEETVPAPDYLEVVAA